MTNSSPTEIINFNFTKHKQPEGDKSISYLSQEALTDVKFYKGRCSAEDLILLNQFAEWADVTAQNLGSAAVRSDIRGTHRAFALGAWNQRGHNSVHFTPVTLTEDGKHAIQRYKKLWDFVVCLITPDFPLYVAKLLTVPRNWRLLGLWTFAMVNLDAVYKLHVDGKDCDFCVVLVMGEFTGGHVCFPTLQLEFQVQRGDVLIFRSCLLPHVVSDVLSGVCYSVVMTTHTKVLELLVGESLSANYQFESNM